MGSGCSGVVLAGRPSWENSVRRRSWGGGRGVEGAFRVASIWGWAGCAVGWALSPTHSRHRRPHLVHLHVCVQHMTEQR